MASFTCTAGDTWVTITVRGIYSGQKVRYFVRRDPGTTGIIDATFTSSGTSLTKTFDGLSQQTRYAVNVGIGNNSDWIGAKYFTTLKSAGGGVEPQRPANWYGWSGFRAGNPVRIYASDWNAFCERINAFREYTGLNSTYLTPVDPGTPISAGIVNLARNAIADMTRNVPYYVNSGDSITASYFISLQSALNSIK